MASQEARTTPKAVSSRLLSMKFMQRAVASTSSPPTTPISEEEQSAKRRKTSHGSKPGKPVTPTIDQEAIQAALEEDDRKRKAAIEKKAEELGDSHWVLGGTLPSKSGRLPQTPLSVVQVGFAEIDTQDSNETSPSQPADSMAADSSIIRRFNMNNKTQATRDDSDSDDGDSDSSSEPSGSPSGDRGREKAASGGSRKRRRSDVSNKRSAERERAQEYAEKRRKKQKQVNLNSLTSISSQGGSSSQPWLASVKCYRCGKTGHRAHECPSSGKR